MKTKEFFEKRLRAPLVNPAWSWGALDEAHERIFLRVHEDCLEPDQMSPRRALLYRPEWEYGSNGGPERLVHIERLRRGFEGFAITYSTFRSGDRWKTKEFDRRFMLRLGRIKDHGRSAYIEVLERVPVDLVVGTAQNKTTEAEIDDEISRDVPITMRQALVKARVGQGIFRDQVLELWSYQCAVTGCGVQEALRASHIKPWSESSDRERLDCYNGLPLLATLDSLFDKHLIGFDPNGKMLISADLSREERRILLPPQRRLVRKPDKRTARLLKVHAEQLR